MIKRKYQHNLDNIEIYRLVSDVRLSRLYKIGVRISQNNIKIRDLTLLCSIKEYNLLFNFNIVRMLIFCRQINKLNNGDFHVITFFLFISSFPKTPNYWTLIFLFDFLSILFSSSSHPTILLVSAINRVPIFFYNKFKN